MRSKAAARRVYTKRTQTRLPDRTLAGSIEWVPTTHAFFLCGKIGKMRANIIFILFLLLLVGTSGPWAAGVLAADAESDEDTGSSLCLLSRGQAADAAGPSSVTAGNVNESPASPSPAPLDPPQVIASGSSSSVSPGTNLDSPLQDPWDPAVAKGIPVRLAEVYVERAKAVYNEEQAKNQRSNTPGISQPAAFWSPGFVVSYPLGECPKSTKSDPAVKTKRSRSITHYYPTTNGQSNQGSSATEACPHC